MLIDWFTVIAQFFNFLLLVWLLKRFLYKPIMNAVDRREQTIQEQLSHAAEQMDTAEILNNQYLSEINNFNSKKEDLMLQAVQEAESVKKNMIDANKLELSHLKQKQKESLRDQEEAYQNNLIKQAQTEIFQIAKKTLYDLSSEEIESHLFRVFMNQIKALTTAQKDELRFTLADCQYKIIFKSSYEMQETDQQLLTNTLTDMVVHPVSLVFVKQSELINGFQLLTGDFKVSWNIEEYLIDLYKKSIPSAKAAVHVKPEE